MQGGKKASLSAAPSAGPGDVRDGGGSVGGMPVGDFDGSAGGFGGAAAMYAAAAGFPGELPAGGGQGAAPASTDAKDEGAELRSAGVSYGL